MRISELFRMNKWSAGMISVIVSGHLVAEIQAQSVAQIKTGQQQNQGTVAPVDSFINDAEKALGNGELKKADEFLRVAEVMMRQQGAASPDAVQRIDRLRKQIDPSGNSRPVELLLAARQKIALGNVEAAVVDLETAKKSGFDFSAAADSPEKVDALLARHREVVALRSSGDIEKFNRAAATLLLEQAGDLIARGDHETTRKLVDQYRLFKVDVSTPSLNPDVIYQRAMDLASQPKTSPQLIAARKAVSMAQLAMDKGEFEKARSLVNEALALNVADSEFGPNEVRPWQLDLQLGKRAEAARASGPVALASATSGQDQMVRQAGYDPAADTTRNVQVSGMESVDADGDEAEQLLFRELFSDFSREAAISERMMSTEPRAALDRMVSLRGKIDSSELSPENRARLLRGVDRDIREMQSYIEKNLPDIVTGEENASRLNAMEMSRERKYEAERQIQKLIEEINSLIDKERYLDAEALVRQAQALAPDDAVVVALTETVRMKVRDLELQRIGDRKESMTYQALSEDMEKMSTPWDSDARVAYGDLEDYSRRMAMRSESLDRMRYSSETERQIWNQLKNSKIQGEFRGTLAETISEMAAQAGVNIIIDRAALEAESISYTQLVDAPLTTPISLDSALKVVLKGAGLVYVVEDEVIKVTSEASSKKDLVKKVYYVGDLVFPVNSSHNPSQMNFITPSMQMNSANQRSGQMNGMNGGNGMSGMPGPLGMNPAGQVLNSFAMAQQMPGLDPLAGAAYGAMNSFSDGPRSREPIYTTTGPGMPGGITQADFMPLIQLITSTIDQESWQLAGNGDGSILPFVTNLSLVVSNTQEVQDEIQDLLERLRSLNDVQIVVEVRFISLTDDFFEKIGVDFDFKLNDNTGINAATLNTALSGSAASGDQLPLSRSFLVGSTGTNPGGVLSPTGDLDVAFTQNTIGLTDPPFGGFTGSTPASIGFAILSDIEVYFLLQASKGNTRTNIGEAPTVTMFNGQSASFIDGSSRPFVTSVTPVVGDFAVAQQPIISILPEGTTLNVMAVASNDRRHVTMSLNPFFSTVESVTEFTFDGSRSVRRSPDNLLTNLANLLDNDPSNDDEDEDFDIVQEGVTIQLPVLSTTTVSTVVQVPDGGSILMGGVKRQSEGRVERGVPFLSNIPYVSRLFKNVGIGRETQNLMMMVTPRIIIQSEEEEIQVGPLGGN